MTDRLILILGDQLSPDIASLTSGDKATDVVLMAEVAEETTYVRHHKKKIALILAAMRRFADTLEEDGWQVDYIRLDDPLNKGALREEMLRAIARHQPKRLSAVAPGEWRLAEDMKSWEAAAGLPFDLLEDDRFIATLQDFANWAEGRKQLRMEYFYREMRRKTGLLMEGGQPVGGKWNFDSDNRKPPRADLFMPQPPRFAPNQTVQDVLSLVEDRFPDHFGDLKPFWFATTTPEAETALDHFIAEALPRFGDFQDAMLLDERFLYHSLLSAYINIGLLDPLAVCRRVEAAFLNGDAPLNAAEGFIRQIIGWREYVRGLYWLKMPDYRDLNHLNAARPLPEFYWSGDTRMACVAAAVTQTKEEAYAHHIQRLMVTGNFAMLAGVAPHEVHEWYLAVYMDAFEWVELPNTIGMSQFADGGIMASKPYAASGAYINRMSDYCKSCKYDPKKKFGPGACPFNPLYWDFLIRNEEELRGNPRLGPVFRTWEKMKDETKSAYRDSAAIILRDLNAL